MTTLWLLLLVPLVWPWIAKYIWPHHISWAELGLNIGIVSAAVAIVYYCGMFGQVGDTEIWNGRILSKKRTHGQYTESYSCNCVTTCTGGKHSTCTTICQTCYREHYTVNWAAKTTAGRDITFKHLDSTSSSVYKSKDPVAYLRAKVDDPVALEHKYVNYVKAVPESLFHDNQVAGFEEHIPQYPRVHDFYQVDRVINIGSTIPAEARKDLDLALDLALRDLGPKKQVNIFAILTEIDDASFRYAVEEAWLGGKKNDVVVFIGLDGDAVTWVDVMTWAHNTGNELFHVTLRDKIREMGTFDSATVAGHIVDTVVSKYDRPHMKDFEYLSKEIEPPSWVIILASVISIAGTVVLSYVFTHTEIGENSYPRYRYPRRFRIRT